MKPSKPLLPEPNTLLLSVLHFCTRHDLVELAQEDIGEVFVREQGIVSLFATYPELRAITPKKSDLNWVSTLEALCRRKAEEYINHYFGKFLQDVMRMQYGKRAAKWRPHHHGGYTERLAVLVAVLNVYAERLQAIDASFVPPDPDAMRGYSIHEEAGGRYVHGLLTKQWLQAFARTHVSASREALREALLHQIARDYAAKYHCRLPARFTYRVFEVGTSEAELEAALAVLEEAISLTPSSSSDAHEESVDPNEEEQPEGFFFIIEITGCQAEWCTHSVEVNITLAELLDWARSSERVKKGTELEGLSAMVLDYLIRERGEAHLDDHEHDFELSFDGEDQLRAMAQAILDDRTKSRL